MKLVNVWEEEDSKTGASSPCRAEIRWDSDPGPYYVTLYKGGNLLFDGARSPDLEQAKSYCIHRYGAPRSGWRPE